MKENRDKNIAYTKQGDSKKSIRTVKLWISILLWYSFLKEIYCSVYYLYKKEPSVYYFFKSDEYISIRIFILIETFKYSSYINIGHCS